MPDGHAIDRSTVVWEAASKRTAAGSAKNIRGCHFRTMTAPARACQHYPSNGIRPGCQPKGAAMPHVYIGPHPDYLGNGAPLALDQVVQDVDLDDPHNAALIAKGWLIPHDEPKPQPKRARAQPIEGEAE